MTNLTARDLMQRDVICVNPETPLPEVHRLFLQEEINGAPVVDESGDVVGLISSMDLVRAAIDEDRGALEELTAADAMVTELVRVRPTASIGEIAKIMRNQRIHRVLVVDDGELLGILSTYDLIGVLETSKAVREPIPRQAGDPVC